MRFPIADGLHTLTCPGTCSVMVHGYDQYVSYGYPGGLDLKDIVGVVGPVKGITEEANFLVVIAPHGTKKTLDGSEGSLRIGR